MIRDVKASAVYTAELVKNHPNFKLVNDPEWATCCFYYYPDRFLNKDNFKSEEEFITEFNKIAPTIKSKMLGGEGRFMIAYMK